MPLSCLFPVTQPFCTVTQPICTLAPSLYHCFQLLSRPTLNQGQASSMSFHFRQPFCILACYWQSSQNVGSVMRFTSASCQDCTVTLPSCMQVANSCSDREAEQQGTMQQYVEQSIGAVILSQPASNQTKLSATGIQGCFAAQCHHYTALLHIQTGACWLQTVC